MKLGGDSVWAFLRMELKQTAGRENDPSFGVDRLAIHGIDVIKLSECVVIG